MTPRLPESKTWTAFPGDLAVQIPQALSKSFPFEASRGQFLFEGRIYGGEILMRIGYLEKGRIKQINIEGSLEHSPEKFKALDRIFLCMDALSAVLKQAIDASFEAQHLDEPSTFDFPVSWEPIQFEGATVYMRYNSENSDLEAEANRLLGLEPDALVVEARETEDALEKSIVDTELAKEVQRRIRTGDFTAEFTGDFDRDLDVEH